MKKNLLYIGVLLLTLYSCKKDADLSEIIPYQFTPTTVEVALQSVTLKADIQTSQSIQEKGFILERTYKSDFNYDNSSIDTIVITADAPFEYTVTSDMEKGQPCTAYAYIKQNGHYYRNEEVTFIPNGCMPPVITSIVSGYDDKTGKYLLIKGENFSKKNERNKLVKIIHENEYFFQNQVIKATESELLVSHGLTDSGELHEICLYVGNSKSSISSFLLDGPCIVSWSPLHPRYGEIINIETQGFNKEWNFHIGATNMNWSNNIQIISVEDNNISLYYHSTDKEASIGIRSYNPEYYFSTGTITTSIPWYKTEQRYDTPHRTYNYIAGKLYIDDNRNLTGASSLRCYNFDAEEWTDYPYEPLEFTPQSQMWNTGKYIYLLHTFKNEWNPTEIKTLRRFNMDNQEWETMNEAPLSTTPRGACNIGEYTYIYYEKECYQYSNSNDTWQKLNGTIKPTISEIVGEYEGNTYYVTSSGKLYRIKTGETGQADFVTQCCESWSFLQNSIKLVGHNLYFCTSNTGIMKYDLTTNTLHHLGLPEEGMEYSHVYTNYSFIEKENDLYIFGGNYSYLYQFVEDREE